MHEKHTYLVSAICPKRIDHNAKKIKKQENKEHRKTIKHEATLSVSYKATQNKNNTGNPVLERSVA